MIESFEDYVETKESDQDIKLSTGDIIVFRNKSIEGKYEGGHASFLSHLQSIVESRNCSSDFDVLFNKDITVLIIDEFIYYNRICTSLKDESFFDDLPSISYGFIEGVDYSTQFGDDMIINPEMNDSVGRNSFKDKNDFPNWLDIYHREVCYKNSRDKYKEIYLEYTFRKNLELQKRKIMLVTNEEKFDKFYSQKKMKKAMRNLLKETELKLKRKR